jgi:hypothetical protein
MANFRAAVRWPATNQGWEDRVQARRERKRSELVDRARDQVDQAGQVVTTLAHVDGRRVALTLYPGPYDMSPASGWVWWWEVRTDGKVAARGRGEQELAPSCYQALQGLGQALGDEREVYRSVGRRGAVVRHMSMDQKLSVIHELTQKGWAVVSDRVLRIAQEAAGAGYAQECYALPLEMGHMEAKAYDALWNRARAFVNLMSDHPRPVYAACVGARVAGDQAFAEMVDRHVRSDQRRSREASAQVSEEQEQAV